MTNSFTQKLLLNSALLVLAGCGTPEDAVNSRAMPKSRLLDRVTPTEAARVRRIGFGMGERIYFIAEMDGRRFSSGSILRSRSTYNGNASIVTETNQTYELVTNANRLQQVDYRKVINDAGTGAALYLTENVNRDGIQETRTITIDRGRALFRVSDNPDQNDEVAVPNGVVFSVSPDWILAQKPQVGKSFRAVVLDRVERQVVTEDITIRDFGPAEVLGVTLNVWTADVKRGENSPLTRMVFTQDGDLVSLHNDNLILRAAPQGEAKLDYAKIESIRSLPISFQLPAWDNFNVLSYRPLPPTRWAEFLSGTSQYQNFNGELKLTKNTPAVGAAVFPLNVPPALLAFCRRGENILPDEREIAERARAIVGNEKNVLPALALIAGWVYQNIALDPIESEDSPLTTLGKQQGDAARHARLFASMARSLNVPTRLCGGLLIQRESAIRHYWCEVNINGRWLPIDTTVNRVGLPAGYILTEVEENGSGTLSNKFALALRDGGMGLEFISAQKSYVAPDGATINFELFPDSKKTYVAVEKNWIANLYWGFSIVKPESWSGNINLQAVTVASENNEAIVKVEALNKVFPCTRAQLDMVIDSLKNALPDFKLLSADLARFGARKNAALFVDFTANQDDEIRRCQMYVIPMRGRSYRVMAWATAGNFAQWQTALAEILDTIGL